LKPHWDKLMAEFEDNETVLVADVDCTADGKTLCEANEIKGYPSIKHGSPDNLQEYEGGRELDDIQEFARKLKPSCSPAKRDLCDKDDLAEIEKYEAVPLADLEKDVNTAANKIKAAESKYKRQVESLQKKYERYTKTKDKKIKKLKGSGLGIKKSVLAYLKKQAKASK